MAKRLQALRDRARAWPPQQLDAALAAVVLVSTLIEALFADASLGARLTALGPAALVAAGLLVRRRHPIAAAGVAMAGILATTALSEPVSDRLEAVFFGWLFVTYSMAARTERRELAVGVALTVAGTSATVLLSTGRVRELFFGLLLFAAGPVAAGRLLRSRVRLGEALREKAERTARERHARAQEAAEDERARIAGELHDVVAHALGAMTIQAAAARRLAAREPQRAAAAFEAVESAGREALGELRTLLEVLRTDGDDPEPELAPKPGMAYLADLAERSRAEGLPVDLDVDGEPPEGLPTGIDLTGYRVVQEALAAAREQGSAGRARVQVRYGEHDVVIEVIDDGGATTLRPLLGLRERVSMCGGEIATGPGGPGEHALRARLPTEGVHA